MMVAWTGRGAAQGHEKPAAAVGVGRAGNRNSQWRRTAAPTQEGEEEGNTARKVRRMGDK